MLEARNIHFAYPGQPELFGGLALSIEPHERVALAAPSGVGKSTLCKLLAGYLTPQQGEVLADGKPLPKRGACPVQLIWQHPEQALDTHMRMQATLREAGEVTPQLREALGIRDEWLSRHPHELSGGELQRFCLARTLAARPRYIIADEISTMLDAVTQARIWHVLLDACAAQNIGLVLVTHSPTLSARLTTRTIQL
ncbi:MAG: ATP-binding cassette domain-containing protein [Coriobacteriales bacterium]|jgi:peptide/nickel transport system ATP-binding protein|nr:ATP-binding cassette domain-containing protein [Coriobacteriales bacterium]